jgi:hypothetical protein
MPFNVNVIPPAAFVARESRPAKAGEKSPLPPFIKGGWGDLKVIFYATGGGRWKKGQRKISNWSGVTTLPPHQQTCTNWN